MIKYPDGYFDDITDDPNSWGMCCSREMAIECAKDHYKLHIKRRRLALRNLIIAEAIIVLVIISAGICGIVH